MSELDPIKAQWPDSKKIKCKDCIHRDKTIIKLDGKILPVGISKSFCSAYPPPPDSNGKPHDVLFLNADCKYYVKEQ